MKIPECEVCQEIYESNEGHSKAPLFLSCGHTICKECLQRLINESEGEEFICPIPKCKNKQQKKRKIEDYNTNKYVIDIINEIFDIPKPEEDCETYKIITLGDCEVGKTSIIERIINKKFVDKYQCTIGLGYFHYYLKYKGKKYILTLIDTNGTEKFKSVSQNYLNDSDGVLFIYDINNKDSFDSLKYWIEFYQLKKKEINGMIIGNKNDLQRQVDLKEASNFAKNYNLPYCEISCKLDKNMKKMIISLLINIIGDKDYESISDSSKNNFEIDNNNKINNNEINNNNIINNNNEIKNNCKINKKKIKNNNMKLKNNVNDKKRTNNKGEQKKSCC